jgi:hypothetical protein
MHMNLNRRGRDIRWKEKFHSQLLLLSDALRVLRILMVPASHFEELLKS